MSIDKEKEEHFDESDQAGMFASFHAAGLKLPDDWYDNRPFEERFKNFGLLVPSGVTPNRKSNIPYIPNKSSMNQESQKSETGTKVKSIIILAECTDGKIRNVLIKPESQDFILYSINTIEGGINILEEPIDGIEIHLLKNKPK